MKKLAPLKTRKGHHSNTHHEYLEDAPEKLRKLILLGEEYNVKDDLKKSEATFKKAAKLAIKEYGEDSPESAMCLYYHAYILEQMSQPLKSLKIQVKLQASEGRVFGEYSYERACTVNNMAFRFEALNDYQNAELCYLWAMKLSKGDPENISEWNNYGAFLIRQGRYKKALEPLTVYMKMAKKIKNKGPEYGKALGFIANAHHKLGHKKLAKKYYLASINHRKKQTPKSDLAITYANFALFYLSDKKYKQAYKYYSLSLELETDPFEKADLMRRLVKIHFVMDESDKALMMIRQSNKLMKKVESIEERKAHYVLICDLLADFDHIDEAQAILIKFEKTLDQTKHKKIYLQINQTIANQYRKNKAYKKAAQFYKKCVEHIRKKKLPKNFYLFNNYCLTLINLGETKAFNSQFKKLSKEFEYGWHEELDYLKHLSLLHQGKTDKLSDALVELVNDDLRR